MKTFLKKIYLATASYELLHKIYIFPYVTLKVNNDKIRSPLFSELFFATTISLPYSPVLASMHLMDDIQNIEINIRKIDSIKSTRNLEIHTYSPIMNLCFI